MVYILIHFFTVINIKNELKYCIEIKISDFVTIMDQTPCQPSSQESDQLTLPNQNIKAPILNKKNDIQDMTTISGSYKINIENGNICVDGVPVFLL